MLKGLDLKANTFNTPRVALSWEQVMD
jgi:hypothetical protein